MLDRRDVGVLRRDRARHGDQGLTGRVGNEVQMEIIGGGRHENSSDEHWVICECLWSLTPQKGLCDTTGGITAKFLHTVTQKDKSASRREARTGQHRQAFS